MVDAVRVWANEQFADSITREEWLEMGNYRNWLPPSDEKKWDELLDLVNDQAETLQRIRAALDGEPR